jgi:hypothetical protein
MNRLYDRKCLFQILLDETLGHPDGPMAPLGPADAVPAPEPARPLAVEFEERRTVDSRRPVARFGDLASRYDGTGSAV